MAITSDRRAIDRKLQLIILQSSRRHDTALELARAIAKGKHPEFSYEREGATHYCSPETIQRYIRFGREVGILEDNLPTKPKGEVNSLSSFRTWLGDRVLRYMADNNCSTDEIRARVAELLSQTPLVLPTFRRVYDKLKEPPPRDTLHLCISVVSLLRPALLRLITRKLILDPDAVDLR